MGFKGEIDSLCVTMMGLMAFFLRHFQVMEDVVKRSCKLLLLFDARKSFESEIDFLCATMTSLMILSPSDLLGKAGHGGNVL